VSKTGQRRKAGCDRLAPNVAAKATATFPQDGPGAEPAPQLAAPGSLCLKGKGIPIGPRRTD
jgi:hypothetical protein